MIDIYHYFLGNYRYKLYYSNNRTLLLRSHIIQQIDFRISVMDIECLSSGSCKICGCQTTALQMSDKSCDKPCYPIMLSKSKWYDFYQKATIIRHAPQSKYLWLFIKTENKLFLLKEENNNYVQSSATRTRPR